MLHKSFCSIGLLTYVRYCILNFSFSLHWNNGIRSIRVNHSMSWHISSFYFHATIWKNNSFFSLCFLLFPSVNLSSTGNEYTGYEWVEKIWWKMERKKPPDSLKLDDKMNHWWHKAWESLMGLSSSKSIIKLFSMELFWARYVISCPFFYLNRTRNNISGFIFK